MSDEERRNDQERTMFDSSLLERIQERELEEKRAQAGLDEDSTEAPAGSSGLPIPPVPPPPPGGAPEDAQSPIASFPPVPPPPPPELDSSEAAQDQSDDTDPRTDPEALSASDSLPPPEEEGLEEFDAPPDAAASDLEPTGVGASPTSAQVQDKTNSEATGTAPPVKQVQMSPDDFPSNADGSLRAIQMPNSVEPSEEAPSSSSDHSTRNLSPVPDDEATGESTDDSTDDSTGGSGAFSDSSTEEREPLEVSDAESTPGPEATGNSMEPTRPGLATNLTTEANLDDEIPAQESSAPTRPQTASAGDQTSDLWAESSVKHFTRSDRKPLKAEETAMLPSPDSPETGEIDSLSADPEPTDEEHGLTLLCDQGGAPPVHVKGDPVVLGRGQAADVTILESTLSRKHCQLELRGSRIWVTDLGSGNGTYINDERIVGAAELKQGDRLRLGLKVSFSLPGDDQTNPTAAAIEEVPETFGNASASGPTLMPDSAGFSTTDGHGISIIAGNQRLKEWAPLAVACLIFIVGLTTQIIRHQNSDKSQRKLNQADAKLMKGVEFFKNGKFKQAEAAIKVAGVQDPNHPMLSRYRERLSTLVRQEATLDDAAALIEQGNIERASALLIALEVEEELKPKAEALVNSMSEARTKDQTKALVALIDEKKFKEARTLLTTLKEAGVNGTALAALEAKLPPVQIATRTAPRRTQSSLPTGPLNRVHRALRAGQIEEAFRINRDLASSGVKEAARLEGNLAELRELLGLAETAVQRRDHVRALTQTSRALKLLKQISPTGVGARNKIRTLRAKAFQAQAQQHGRAGRACEARQSLDQAARFNRNIPGLTNGFRVVENHGSSELAEAREEIQRGASLASVRHKLEMAICTHGKNSKVSKEARRLLRGP